MNAKKIAEIKEKIPFEEYDSKYFTYFFIMLSKSNLKLKEALNVVLNELKFNNLKVDFSADLFELIEEAKDEKEMPQEFISLLQEMDKLKKPSSNLLNFIWLYTILNAKQGDNKNTLLEKVNKNVQEVINTQGG